MKKLIIAVIVVAGLIYLYLTFAAEADRRQFKKSMELQPDSVRINDSTYHFKKADSNKATQ